MNIVFRGLECVGEEDDTKKQNYLLFAEDTTKYDNVWNLSVVTKEGILSWSHGKQLYELALDESIQQNPNKLCKL